MELYIYYILLHSISLHSTPSTKLYSVPLHFITFYHSKQSLKLRLEMKYNEMEWNEMK
jgi:hypothetical protein